MRYSTFLGIGATIALFVICWMPWVYIPSVQRTITGFYSEGTNFGHPGLMHYIIGSVAIIFFIIKNIIAKRANIFFCTFNFAWSLRNFLLITHCELGECPEKKIGIYLVVCLSFLMMLMSLLPPNKEQSLKKTSPDD